MKSANFPKLLSEGLRMIEEPGFTFCYLAPKYEVTLNHIQTCTYTPPHSHERNVVNIVLNGQIEISIDGATKKYDKGDFVFIQKNVEHTLKCLNEASLIELWEK